VQKVTTAESSFTIETSVWPARPHLPARTMSGEEDLEFGLMLCDRQQTIGSIDDVLSARQCSATEFAIDYDDKNNGDKASITLESHSRHLSQMGRRKTPPLSDGPEKKAKVKASHTRSRALGPELIPVYRQSART